MPKKKDITVSPGENLTLTCQGNDGMWKFFNVITKQSKKVHLWLNIYFFLQKFRHIQYDIVVNKTNNETVLKLWNISHIYVGYYYCIKVIRDEKKEYDLNAMMLEEGVDKIYLFVKGCHSIYLNS